MGRHHGHATMAGSWNEAVDGVTIWVGSVLVVDNIGKRTVLAAVGRVIENESERGQTAVCRVTRPKRGEGSGEVISLREI